MTGNRSEGSLFGCCPGCTQWCKMLLLLRFVCASVYLILCYSDTYDLGVYMYISRPQIFDVEPADCKQSVSCVLCGVCHSFDEKPPVLVFLFLVRSARKESKERSFAPTTHPPPYHHLSSSSHLNHKAPPPYYDVTSILCITHIYIYLSVLIPALPPTPALLRTPASKGHWCDTGTCRTAADRSWCSYRTLGCGRTRPLPSHTLIHRRGGERSTVSSPRPGIAFGRTSHRTSACFSGLTTPALTR